jgi:predicted lipoprotein with Yx(FWY)xxD motif
VRRGLLLALTLSCGAALISSIPVATAATRATGAMISLEKTKKFGKILANGRGFTVYAYSRDTPGHEQCQSFPGCTSTWPAVITKGKPVAGTGVRQKLLGTIKLKNGKLQVTYNKHPLYTYTADGAPHQTFYVNMAQAGGRWPAVNAAGGLVK